MTDLDLYLLLAPLVLVVLGGGVTWWWVRHTRYLLFCNFDPRQPVWSGARKS